MTITAPDARNLDDDRPSSRRTPPDPMLRRAEEWYAWFVADGRAISGALDPSAPDGISIRIKPLTRREHERIEPLTRELKMLWLGHAIMARLEARAAEVGPLAVNVYADEEWQHLLSAWLALQILGGDTAPASQLVMIL